MIDMLIAIGIPIFLACAFIGVPCLLYYLCDPVATRGRRFKRYYTSYLRHKGNVPPRLRARIAMFVREYPGYGKYFDME